MNHQQTIEIQQKMVFLASFARDIRGDLLLYTQAARDAIGGRYLTSGETPEALQKALPRLAIYAELGEHLVAIADLFDKMGALVRQQATPEGRIILPMRMAAQAAAEAPSGASLIEAHAGRLYETYCAAVGGAAHSGRQLPNWPQFRGDPGRRKQSDAWVAVAALSLSSPTNTPTP